MRVTPKLMNHIILFYFGNVFMDFQFNFMSSIFQEGQFESHLLD